MSGRWDRPVIGRGPPRRTGDWGDGEDVVALGQAVAGRLYTAGLDLHYALMLIGDGPAARRCTTALDEIDDAIKQVRHLVLAAHERLGDGQLPASYVPSRAARRGEPG